MVGWLVEDDADGIDADDLQSADADAPRIVMAVNVYVCVCELGMCVLGNHLLIVCKTIFRLVTD